MHLDPDRVRADAARACTEDLLDRVTVFRAGMDPEALPLLEDELRRRGISAADQVDHQASRTGVLRDHRGLPLLCERCRRPAVWQGRRWHRLFGRLPLFPRRMALCAEHAGLPITSPTPASERPPE